MKMTTARIDKHIRELHIMRQNINRKLDVLLELRRSASGLEMELARQAMTELMDELEKA